MSASASGDGERAGEWEEEEGMLPLPLVRAGVTVPAFGAIDGVVSAGGVVGEGAEERINVAIDGLVTSPVARGEDFGQEMASMEGFATGLVVAV